MSFVYMPNPRAAQQAARSAARKQRKNRIPKPKFLKKYQLELRWESIEYLEGDLGIFQDAHFTGPVLKEAAQIRPHDQLIIDMTEQHSVLALPDYYQAYLKWNEVIYKGDKVFLGAASIRGKYVHSLEKLRDRDWILIDCELHEESKHPFNLVYMSKVMKPENEDKY